MRALTIASLLFLACYLLSQNWAAQQWHRRSESQAPNGAADVELLRGGGNPNGSALTSGSLQGIDDVPLLLELLAAASDAGMSLVAALRSVSQVASCDVRDGLLRVITGLEIGASWEHSWAAATGNNAVESIGDALRFGAMTGAPAAPLMYAQARTLRKAQQRAAEKKAATLSVKLVVPLGLCSLPAFVALGIIPVVIAMLPSF